MTKHEFLTGNDMGSDHLPIEISIDAQPNRNTHPDPIMSELTLEAAMSSGDISELKSSQDIDMYADFIVTTISIAVDKAIPTSKRGRPESQRVSDETLVLIKEKRRLRRQCCQALTLFLTHPLVKTRINQLQ